MSITNPRVLERNVFIYDLRDVTTVLGGLVATPGITNETLYSMVEIAFTVSHGYFIQNGDGEELPQDQQPLVPGSYLIVHDDPIGLSPEPFLDRTLSRSTGSRVEEFRDAVRERDQRCVLTKRENLLARQGFWGHLKAAHIFPLARENDWNSLNLGRYISLPPAVGGPINSVQNGLLLEAGIHVLFDSYIVSINPDDNYKIVCFQPDVYGVAGTFLDRRLLDDPRRPPDELFRWHFRQAVLANVRGVGEPVWEFDFPPGMDDLEEIMSGPKAAERMEAELFSRLAAETELGD